MKELEKILPAEIEDVEIEADKDEVEDRGGLAMDAEQDKKHRAEEGGLGLSGYLNKRRRLLYKQAPYSGKHPSA